MDEDKRWSYFCLGLGIGAALGLLFAPRSGRDTRRYLADKSHEGRDYLVKSGEKLRDATTDIVDRGKSALQRQKEQLSAAVEAGKQAYRETVKEASGPDKA